MAGNLQWIVITLLIFKDAAGNQVPKLRRIHPDRTITVELEEESDEQSRTLPCGFEGPFTKVNWTKKHDYNWSVQPPNSLDQNNSLVLMNLKPSDSGKYVCNVSVDGDSEKSDVTVEVTLKMKETSMINQTVLVNSTVQFECLLKHGIRQEFRVVFFKYQIEKQKQLRNLRKIPALNQHNESHLVLKNVTALDEDWYTCAVVNGTNYQISEEKRFELNFLSYKSTYLRVMEKLPDEIIPEENSIFTYVALISTAAGAIIILATILGVTCYKMKKKRLTMPVVGIKRQPTIMVMNNIYQPCQDYSGYKVLTNMRWEFPRAKLTLGKVLGEGAFGKVVLAEALDLSAEGETINVAVKMLKENHTDDDVKDFMSEMELLKKIDKHPNVISFLGNCTRGGPLYMIVEYAAHGNLKNFLRERRTTLDAGQLISFALQISKGMEFLASKMIIHRDLAARNILVGENFTMKITDFGLARDVYSHDYYRKMTSGKLPIYWMAPESLEEWIFDSKSDVWSFGVLFWEIMTLGRHPYSVAPSWDSLLQYLMQGNRLERPESCPDGVYQIMSNCWQFDAALRPTFSEIVAALESVINVNDSDENANQKTKTIK